MEPLEFNDFVSGIEDGILGVVETKRKKTGENPDGYLKDVGWYAGELDEKTIRAAIDEFQGRMPLALIGYTDGEDKLSPATAPVFGRPRTYRHDCSFAVIAAAEDARGATQQRKGAIGNVGVYKMLADFRQDLGGLWLIRKGNTIVARVGDKKLANDEQLLTYEPLKVAGVQYLARLPNVTVYAALFDTHFIWTESDRRAAGTPVSELIFELNATGAEKEPGTLPGVQVET